MPEEWWTDHCQNSNGYFGYADEVDNRGVVGLSKLGSRTGKTPFANMEIDAWTYFESKHLEKVEKGTGYVWYKLNVFTRWITETKQTIILLFDITPMALERIKKALTNVQSGHLSDPLWAYTKVANELVFLEDDAVWAIRNQVRSIEKRGVPSGKPNPDYRLYHDLDRHAIHVTESLEVSAQTLDGILSHHEAIKERVQDQRLWQNIHQQLVFSRNMIGSLLHRSVSNEKRLQNEIHLAFNIVAQYDSRIGVQIGAAARIDSAAMKTISLVTLAFLPPTFICAIFSMSFFNFDSDVGWRMSDRFWLYWAFAIPTTVITSVICYYWQRLFSSSGDSKVAFGDLTRTLTRKSFGLPRFSSGL
jgi:Mg2+ and Co2+ transporter CorA